MQKIKDFIKNNQSKLITIFIILLTFILTYFFPYTHDDWAWGTKMGLDRLNTLFKDYNGRYLGNLLVLLLTRNRLLRAIVITTTLTIIMYLVNKITDSSKITKYISILLLLFIPISILAQSIAWTSGFTNYVPPLVFILGYLYIFRNIFTSKKIEVNNKLIIPLLIMGICVSLFIEHVTIYNLILAIFITIYASIKNKKLNIPSLFYLIGSLSGTLIMFSNGAYGLIASSNDSYRTIASGNIITNAFNTYLTPLKNYILLNNVLISLIIAILMLIIGCKFLIKNKPQQVYKRLLLYGSICTYLFYILYIVYLYMGGNNVFIYPTYRRYIEALLVIMYFISALIITIYAINNKERQKRLIFDILSIAILSAPLLIVTPIGSRNFFPMYIFYIMIVCELLEIIFNNRKTHYDFIIIISIIIVFGFHLLIYGYSFKIDQERIAYIKNNIDHKKMVLPLMPNTKYMQFPNPGDESFEEKFKLFYQIPEDTELEFVEYIKWYNNYK